MSEIDVKSVPIHGIVAAFTKGSYDIIIIDNEFELNICG